MRAYPERANWAVTGVYYPTQPFAMNVLLTGANGFLGSHIARQLIERGYTVRALLRPNSPTPTLNDLPIVPVPGDLRDRASVVRAADDCQYIIHAGALASVNPARNKTVWDINLDGTENVLRAAHLTGVERLVYVGTANVFGFGTKTSPGNENSPYVGTRYGLDYMDSKEAATRRVMQSGVPAVSVHPTFMLGSMDHKPTSGALLLGLYKRQVAGTPVGGKNYVHVADVATATVNALTKGRVGEQYILGNQNLSYAEAFALMAEVMGCRAPSVTIPKGLAWVAGQLSQLQATLTRKPARLNPAMVAVANDGHYFEVQKAIRELNLPQTPVQEAIRDAFDWFRANGYV
ncbi:NAD-dependent epimerase/dehydratase family protein [Rudanella lutea]|uniref:NAD-dependent epimerase/dehydratase family protein n=1 Tax=Rudanella lutea TaxID=451374 RepID=UPI00036A2D95